MIFPRVEDAQNIFDLRDMAKRRLPRWLFEFVDRGTEDEVALRNNREAFERIQLRPRMLVDVSGRKLDTTIYGKEHKMPIGIAPTGAAGMMWYQGELELARAAKAAGIPFSLATGSITSMEKISGEVGGTLWMQLYMWADRRLSHQLVRRASAAGFEALLVTVDGAVAGNREYNRRNGFSVPFKYNSRNTHRCAHASALDVRRAGTLSRQRRHAHAREFSRRVEGQDHDVPMAATRKPAAILSTGTTSRRCATSGPASSW